MRLHVGVAALSVLVGCSSSGGGSSAISRDAQAEAIAAAFAAENISDPTSLPNKGSATYAGFMTLGLPIDGDTTDRVGDLNLTVDFGAARNQVTGSVSNIDGLGGALAIRGGDIDRETNPKDDYTFGGSVTGDLTRTGDTFAINATIAGDFRGRNQDGVTGLVYGNIDGQDGQDLFDGTFAATRGD